MANPNCDTEPSDVSDATHVPVELVAMPASRTVVWLTLQEHGPMTRGEITERVDLSRSRVSEACLDVQNAGLVEKLSNLQNPNVPKYRALGEAVTVEDEDDSPAESRAFTPERARRAQADPIAVGLLTLWMSIVLLVGYAIVVGVVV